MSLADIPRRKDMQFKENLIDDDEVEKKCERSMGWNDHLASMRGVLCTLFLSELAYCVPTPPPLSHHTKTSSITYMDVGSSRSPELDRRCAWTAMNS